jgi:hypothetical protein
MMLEPKRVVTFRCSGKLEERIKFLGTGVEDVR